MCKNLLPTYLVMSVVICIIIGFCGCIDQTPLSMSVKVHVYVSGNNETITPDEQIISINRSSNATVTFTLHATEPRDYSQIAISINVSGIMDPIICPANFSNYERNESGNIINFSESVPIYISLFTNEDLPKDIQTATVYYSSKEPTI